MQGDRPVYPVLRQLTTKPPIVTQVDELLTPAECAYLVQAARDAGFQASEIQGRGEVRSLRTSRTAYLPEGDPVVQCIKRRFATIAGMPASSLEPLQATSYARGERYKTHHDVPRDVGGRRLQAPTDDHLRIFTSRRRVARGEVWRGHLLPQVARKRWEEPARVPARWERSHVE